MTRIPVRVAVLLLLGLTLTLTPLSPAALTAGGTFRVAEPATYIDSIDGTMGGLAGDTIFLNVACASLMRLQDKPLPAGFRVFPDLASGFPKVSADGKTYHFTIRRGARFNTGAPVTAADVANTINRVLSPALSAPAAPAFAAVVGAQDVLAGKAKSASGIAASGRKLTIRLTHPDGGFIENAATGLCVVPAGLQVGPGGVTPPVPSAAPYYISGYVPSQRIALERNPYYRGPRPRHVDRFVFDLSVDENQALDDVLNGTADYAWVPNHFFSSRAAEFARRFGVNKTRYFVKPGTLLHLFALNTSRPLLRNNASLRRAINFAIDRPALLGQLPGPYVGTPVDHYVLPIMPGYRSTQVYPRRKPDVRKARALAKGHTRSGKLVLYVPTRAGAPAQAQIVKQNLGRIRLDVEIRTFPAGPLYFQKLANPKEPFDMAWIGFLFPTPDPGSLGGLFDGSTIGKPGNSNLAYFNSPRWNRALREASRRSGDARFRAFGRLDIQIARDEAPYVAYGVDDAITLVSSRTGCVVVNPSLDLDAVCLK